MYSLVALLLFLFQIVPARADNATFAEKFKACFEAGMSTAKVQKINTFGDIFLEDGTTLRLADTHFTAKDTETFIEPSALKAMRALMVGQKAVYLQTQKQDRYQRLPSQIWILSYESDPLWVQEFLVREGYAVFMPDPEKSALPGRNCLPSDIPPFKHVSTKPTSIKTLSSDNPVLWSKEGEFVIVTGVVRSVYQARQALFLNLGENWKNDFSILIPKTVKFKTEYDNKKLIDIVGTKVKVRGYLDLNNGPLVSVDHPAQLQFFDGSED